MIPNYSTPLSQFRAFFKASIGCLQVIPNLSFAEQWNILGVRGLEVDRIQAYELSLPVGYSDTQDPHVPSRADWYIPRKLGAAFDWLPKLLFDKLCFFKLASRIL